MRPLHRFDHPRNDTPVAIGDWPCPVCWPSGAIHAWRPPFAHGVRPAPSRGPDRRSPLPPGLMVDAAPPGRGGHAPASWHRMSRRLGTPGRALFAHLAPCAIALALLAHAPAFAQAGGTADRTMGSPPAQDIVWTDNQDSSVCPRRPTWTIAVQGTALLLKTRNFDYQIVPIALRGDGSASMDRVFQPGRNLKYRVIGTFDGKGRMRLRLEDLAREGGPCSWRFEAEYQDGVVPGVKATRSRTP